MPTQRVNQQALEAAVTPVCTTEGVELVLVRHQRDRDGDVLRVLIEHPRAEELPVGTGGVTLEDCTRVSRALSEVLDAQPEIVEGTYRLEVSSPGIERPLVKRVDFERFAGREACVRASGAAHGDRRQVTGTLVGLENDDVVLLDQRGEKTNIPFDSISRANLVHRF